MRQVHKLRSVPSAGQEQAQSGRYVEGWIIARQANGRALFRNEAGDETEVRVPRHVDRRWLEAAVALAPVPAVALVLESGHPVLAHVFAAPEHEALDEHFRVDAKTIELSAKESIRIRTGKSIVTVTAEGEVSVRGRNVTTRASNCNRVRGGAVKIN
jgi:hypothetical protein